MPQSVAPLVAAQRRPLHWAFGAAQAPIPASLPDGGTGDTIGLKVELYLGSGLGWVDVSPQTYYRDMIKISRGRGDETSQVSPQTCALTLNNRGGVFTPRNPVGPLYGLIGRNTPIRVSRLNNGVRRYRYYGEVPAWPTTSDISGQDVYEQITAAGVLRRLSQGTKTLGSSLYRAYTVPAAAQPFLKPAASLPLAAYWPCQDGANATSIASGIAGGYPLTLSGQANPKFAANTDFVCSDALPLLSASIWTGTVPAYSGGTDNVFNFLLSVPATGAFDGAVVGRLFTAGAVARLDVTYFAANNGTLQMSGFDASGTQLFASAVIGTLSAASSPIGINGVPVRVQMRLLTNGANITRSLQVLNVATGTGRTSTGTLSASAVGNATIVVINPDGHIDDSAVGHVSVQWSFASQLFDTLPLTAWIGEPADMVQPNSDFTTSRFTRLCLEQGVESVVVSSPAGYDVDPGPVSPTGMGYQTSDTFGNLIQQVPDTTAGLFFEARDQLALAIRTRQSLYNQAPKLTLDHSLHEFSGPLNPLDDDQLTRNDVSVTRIGASSYTVQQASGTLSIQNAPAGVGDYQTTYSISLASDSLLPDAAGWRLHMGTVDSPRFPQLSLNLRHPTFTGNVDMMNAALTLDVGDRILIVNPPPDQPPDPITLIVQGYTETLGIYEHDMVISCSPEAPYEVGFTDDPVLGRADTDGSTLAGDINATATSFQVATTGAATGSPLWTTSAGDFPFDVIMGGEVITVTNITGGSSPQTFGPCTRSVNGVVKTQTAGTDVRLHQPTYTSW